MKSSDSKTAVFDGIKIAYQSHGSGNEALVFIHGWYLIGLTHMRLEELVRRTPTPNTRSIKPVKWGVFHGD